MIVGAGIGLLFGGSLVPQTLLLGQYRRVLASYKDGEEEDTTEDLVALKDKVWCKLIIFAQGQPKNSSFPRGL